MEEDKKTEESKKPSGKDQPHPTQKQPTAIVTSESSITKKEAIKGEKKTNDSDSTRESLEIGRLRRTRAWVRDPKHSSAVQAIFTAVIMLTGILYTVFAGLQWSVMRESNRINHDALVSVQRAFVTYSQTMEALAVPAEENQQLIANWEFRIKMTNSGVTPTKNAVQYINLTPRMWNDPLPDNFTFEDVGDRRSTRFIIGPKAVLSKTLIDPLRAGEQRDGWSLSK